MDDLLRERSNVTAAMAESQLGRMGADPAGGLVYAVEALRLAVLAAASPDDPGEAVPEEATWARVELFGHSVRIGVAREVERFGRRWIEVVQPALWRDPEIADDPARDEPDLPVTVKLYHPNAVYAIEEYDDDAEGERAYRNSRGVWWSDDPRESF